MPARERRRQIAAAQPVVDPQVDVLVLVLFRAGADEGAGQRRRADTVRWAPGTDRATAASRGTAARPGRSDETAVSGRSPTAGIDVDCRYPRTRRRRRPCPSPAGRRTNPPYLVPRRRAARPSRRGARADSASPLIAVEQAAVRRVGPALGDDVEVAGHRHAVLGGHHALDDLHLADRLDADDVDLADAVVLRELARARRCRSRRCRWR